MLINLFFISECFKVYFRVKSWFLKHKSGLLHGYRMKTAIYCTYLPCAVLRQTDYKHKGCYTPARTMSNRLVLSKLYTRQILSIASILDILRLHNLKTKQNEIFRTQQITLLAPYVRLLTAGRKWSCVFVVWHQQDVNANHFHYNKMD